MPVPPLPVLPTAVPPETLFDPATSVDLGPVLRRLVAEIGGLMQRGPGTAPPAFPVAAAAPVLPEANSGSIQVLADGIAQLRLEMHQRFQALLDEREAEQQAARQAKHEAAWQEAVFGPELGRDDRLKPYRQALVDGLLQGNPTALGMAGHLLVFHAASADRVPNLLKDIGEAYYRWRPGVTAADPLTVALIDWLTRKSDAAGVRNRIELVDPGCRFNSNKHRTNGTGVEVTEVQGWVVLRADGVVFHKASVSVR